MVDTIGGRRHRGRGFDGSDGEKPDMWPDGQGDPGGRGLVLVVEDERAIAELISLYLRRDGFGVHVATDGLAGLAAIRRMRPVAVVLDVGLPGMDGVEVCRTIRAEDDWTPVLFVTARDDEVDRVLGLELGADDYVTKPFSPRELAARVRTVLRRASGVAPDVRVHAVGTVRADVSGRRVWAADREVPLTSTEFDLLVQLVRHPGRVFTREQLLSAVWGYAAAAGTRTVDVHVAQLRAKLGEHSPIRTVRGVGYSAEAVPGPGSSSVRPS
jgi:DNA-binding response OmpR family regulator